MRSNRLNVHTIDSFLIVWWKANNKKKICAKRIEAENSGFAAAEGANIFHIGYRIVCSPYFSYSFYFCMCVLFFGGLNSLNVIAVRCCLKNWILICRIQCGKMKCWRRQRQQIATHKKGSANTMDWEKWANQSDNMNESKSGTTEQKPSK